ncbi:hypothetical protein GOQ29_04670 [Clostridium sp. D2Q-14]|uniref:hypothetical protein n=1 Tax=Anaeromonas gelatinilytica TaxID=2683194 RepID=UPI00193B2B12|nr:hypothetical protein [Anaeromonas gelatinilytica]
MKFKALFISLILVVALLAGCGNNDSVEEDDSQVEDNQKDTEEDVTDEGDTDAVTTASIVNEEEDFKEAISEDGTWLIATLTDLSFDEELVLEGEFTNNDETARKIALYEQDEDRNVTARYTLTAPKLTIDSPNARIQSGTFAGDIYVEENAFQLVDTTVEGNVYFASEEYKESFDKDDDSKITGEIEVKE